MIGMCKVIINTQQIDEGLSGQAVKNGKYDNGTHYSIVGRPTTDKQEVLKHKSKVEGCNCGYHQMLYSVW
jgi:hypothetical protein